MVPAIYAGCILALLPLFGIQLPIAFALALIFRANLPVLAGLQFISNPLTILPIYFSSYQIGRTFLGIFGVEVSFLGRRRFEEMLNALREGSWGENFNNVATVFGISALGGAIVGLFIAFIAATIYRLLAKPAARGYSGLSHHLHEQRERRHERTDAAKPVSGKVENAQSAKPRDTFAQESPRPTPKQRKPGQ